MQTLVALSYAILFAVNLISNFILVPIHVNMILSSVCTIYIGCHRSIKNAEIETMSTKDAYMFPLVGSCVLFGLYLLFKFLNKDYVNFLLTAYIFVLGVFALGGVLKPAFVDFVPKREKAYEFKLALPVLGQQEIKFDNADIVSVLVGAVLGTWYLITKHWCGNNLLGIAFSIQGIEHLSLGSYKVGAILLSGLFFYDVFWVFGTDVMVTVAKSFNAPIKLLFPKAFATADAAAQYSMLGLGDIVIPGIFIALMLRFDLSRFVRAQGIVAGETPEQAAKRLLVVAASVDFPKPYFNTNMLAYALGLVATVLVMYAFKAAQPALLYLVPACLGASMLTGASRRELYELFAYSEEKGEDTKKD